jgi:hypothetical protein
MTISKSVEQTKAGLRIKSTKGGKPRTIGLDDFVLEVLAAHREAQKQDKIVGESCTRWEQVDRMMELKPIASN